MKFSILAAALASTSTVYAHSTFFQAWKNGVDLGAGIGSYIRGPASNSPVKDVKSQDIICNTNNSPVGKTIEVVAGDVLTLEWKHDNPGDDIIDPTHKGPLMVYVAPTSSNGVGAVWNKIFDQTFTSGSWAVDKLIAAKGTHSITVPDLAAGEYLIRPEIIALHESDTDFAVNSARGAQFYMGCMQIKVVSSGSVKLPAGINFQTDYKSNGQGILFNLYSSPATSYVSPGSSVASFAVAGAGIGPVPAPGTKPTTTTAPVATPTTTTKAASTTKPVTSALPTSKMTTVTIRSTTTAAPTPTSPSSGATVAKYGQCGGQGYSGSKVCASGSTCKYSNDWYSQCL